MSRVDRREVAQEQSGAITDPATGMADAREKVFGALANESRRTILTILHSRGDSLNSGEIARHFDTTWQTISRHLRVLEEAGLIGHEKRGRDHSYTVRTARLQAVAGTWLRGFVEVGPPAGDARASSG